MRILGLTGDIACGKSTVAALLAEQGVEHLDSDHLVHELYADADFAARLAQQFGDVLDSQGHIDRHKLAPLVFGEPATLLELERVVHPAVAELRARKLAVLASQGVSAVVIEAVKLLESGQGAGCDEVWCVVCDPAVQLERLMRDRELTAEAAQIRLHNQPSRAAKELLAGEVPLVWIPNNGTRTELATLVAREWARFCPSEIS